MNRYYREMRTRSSYRYRNRYRWDILFYEGFNVPWTLEISCGVCRRGSTVGPLEVKWLWGSCYPGSVYRGGDGPKDLRDPDWSPPGKGLLKFCSSGSVVLNNRDLQDFTRV